MNSFKVNYTIVGKTGTIYKINLEVDTEELKAMVRKMTEGWASGSIDLGRFSITSDNIESISYFDYHCTEGGDNILFPEVH